jgi:ABC-type multidrug transport system fused ATPase/permease subunit
LPETFIQGIQAYKSMKRIERFLQEQEIQQPQPQPDAIKQEVGFKKATLGWSQEGDGFILKDLDATFPRNQLSLISGATGSGKTLMLLGLLGEACVLQGQAHCPRVPVADTLALHCKDTSDKIAKQDWILERSLAYVSQAPWLQNASIRDNILFGLPHVADRYRATLTTCALDKDMTILEDGDQTEIGEKGITLSGGQKARVALARAVYSRAGILLMDDCLSAVDAHTAKHLYTQCLMGPLMANRTRILVTHHVKLCLSSCAYLIHIKDGRAEFVGSPMELRQTGHLDEVLAEDEEEDEEEEVVVAEQQAIEDMPSSSSSAHDAVKDEKKPRALIAQETRATGSIKFSLYKIYFALVGNRFYWLILALLVFGARGLEIGESWWIKKWAESYTVNATSVITTYAQPKFYVLASHPDPSMDILSHDQHIFQTPSNDDNLNYYLGVYCLIAVANVLVGCSRYAFIYYGSLRANRQLYKSLLQRVLRAPLRFFDTTPMGRILNRFSKDFESIDSHVPTELISFIIQWFTILTTAITICAVIPALVVAVVLVAVLNVYIGLRYVNSSRELKRLESVTRSPVFSCFTETVAGVATIRAYGATQQFLQVMVDHVDANMRPFMLTWLCNRWVSVRYALTSACVNLFAFAIVFASRDHIDVPLAGFGLSFVLMFSDNMFWGVRQYTGVEMAFNSVERVVEFTEMEQEPPAVTDTRPPPKVI